MSSKMLAGVLIILLAATLAFVRCLPNDIFWDDEILLNQRLSPENCRNIGDVWAQPYWGLTSGPADTYRPLSLSVIYLEHLAFGQAHAPYRAISILIHAINSLLVFYLVSKLAGRAIGWPAALLFAVHPVHVEAVAMIYGQLELISFMFIMLALITYQQALAAPSKARPMALALLFGFLAYCSKESALMLPALMVLLRLCYHPVAESSAHEPVGKRFISGLGWEICFGLIAIPYLVLRFQALGGLAPDAANTVSSGYSTVGRIHAVIVAVAHGLRLCTVPMGQSLYYGHLRDSVFGRPTNEILWLVIAATCLWMLVSEIGRRALIFGIGWYLLALAPVANIIPSGVLVAERTLYLPSFGICFLGGALVQRFISAEIVKPAAVRLIFASVLILYASASTVVAGRLRTAETHWRSTVQSHPRSPLAHEQLGQVILKRLLASNAPPSAPELDEANAHFQKAFELNSTLAESLMGQAIVARLKGDKAALEALYRKLIETNPQATIQIQAMKNLLEKP